MSELPNSSLQPLGTKETLGGYLAQLWARREFAVALPANDLRAQNMDTVLGQLWHILNPAALVAVYWLVFGVLLKTDRGLDNFLGFLVIGVLVFQLTQRVVQDGAVSILRNEELIRSIRFPRALLPISSLIGQTIAFGPALLVMLVTVTLTGEAPTLRWFVFPLILVAQAGFNVGAGLVAARLGTSLRDLQQILPHLFRIIFYMSGVLFSVDRVISNETVVALMAVNPIYSFVTASRWALLGTGAGVEIWVSVIVWSVVTPIVGLVYFRARELRYGA